MAEQPLQLFSICIVHDGGEVLTELPVRAINDTELVKVIEKGLEASEYIECDGVCDVHWPAGHLMECGDAHLMCECCIDQQANDLEQRRLDAEGR
ncbi:MAG: hypothetical protein ACXAEN_17495 [Candidatus Thorarchaeota archaeon]|jgi:hypothetical protein